MSSDKKDTYETFVGTEINQNTLLGFWPSLFFSTDGENYRQHGQWPVTLYVKLFVYYVELPAPSI